VAPVGCCKLRVVFGTSAGARTSRTRKQAQIGAAVGGAVAVSGSGEKRVGCDGRAAQITGAAACLTGN